MNELTHTQIGLIKSMRDGRYLYRRPRAAFWLDTKSGWNYGDARMIRPLIEQGYLYVESETDGDERCTRTDKNLPEEQPLRPYTAEECKAQHTRMCDLEMLFLQAKIEYERMCQHLEGNPEDRPAPIQPLLCSNCGRDTGLLQSDDNRSALCEDCEHGTPTPAA